MPYGCLNFRPINLLDTALLNKLMREGKGYWGYPEDRLDIFMEKFGINDPSFYNNAFGFIAEENDKVIGQYVFQEKESPPYLDHFFLDVQMIGKGYGRKLWEHCINQARLKGWKEFIFWSDPNSKPFYEHMGAVTFEHRPMMTMPGHLAPIMRYVIENS